MNDIISNPLMVNIIITLWVCGLDATTVSIQNQTHMLIDCVNDANIINGTLGIERLQILAIIFI